jgi:hypothetical protein
MPRTTFLQKPLPCVHGYATKDCPECGPAAEHGARFNYEHAACHQPVPEGPCLRDHGHPGPCSPNAQRVVRRKGRERRACNQRVLSGICRRSRGHTGGCSPVYELTLPARAAHPPRRHQ